MAFVDGPLLRHLREIVEGHRPVPTTKARRHHWVPAFALSRFATPSKRHGTLFQLETRTGRPAKTTPDTTAFLNDLYAREVEQGPPDMALEAFLAVIENYAAQAFDRLLPDPLNLSGEDRQTLSYFLAFQNMRTPVALDHSMATQQAMMELMLSVQFSSEKGFRTVYRNAVDEPASDHEIEQFRRRVRGQLRRGELTFDDPKAQAFHTMLKTADPIAHKIAQLEWGLLTAKESEFVTSDRPMAMHDPNPPHPWSGHALLSSPDAETTFPVSPEHCLVLFQGQPRIGTGSVDAEGVLEINLRTYSWAAEFIYGRSQELVQETRRQAKRHPNLLIKPRKSKQVVLEEADPEDPNVGREHAKKGWPRGLWAEDADGVPRFYAYSLIDPTDPSSIRAAIEGDEIGRRVMSSAAARRKDPGRDT